MWEYYNPNPRNARVGDCTIRAVCKATGQEWEETYLEICLEGLLGADMPSSNAIWGGRYLKNKGFKKAVTEPLTKVRDFCKQHPKGTYVVVLENHVVTIIDSIFYDTWDSGDEVILYYWEKE